MRIGLSELKWERSLTILSHSILRFVVNSKYKTGIKQYIIVTNFQKNNTLEEINFALNELVREHKLYRLVVDDTALYFDSSCKIRLEIG